MIVSGSDALCLGAPPGLREAIVSAAKRRLSKQKPVEEQLWTTRHGLCIKDLFSTTVLKLAGVGSG